MYKSIEAIYENGIFKPLQKIDLEEHQKINLVILPTEKELNAWVESQKKELNDIIGIGKSGLKEFVGKYVIEELLKNGFKLKCLVRLGSEKKLSKYKNIEITMGDITDYESLLNGMEECSAVINQGRYCGGAYSNKRINN